MTDELNEYQKDYLELSVKYIVMATCKFYEEGGQIAKSKLTVAGHRIPCQKCGGNARRYIPGELKPICEKCWSKKMDAGLNELFMHVMLRKAVDELCEALGGNSNESE